MAKKYKYSFAQRQQAKGGVQSSILACISCGLLLLAVIFSFVMGGRGGLFIGWLGLMAILFSAYGFFLGLRSFGEQDRQRTFSIVGSISNGILMVTWLGLFLVGVA